MPDTLFTIGYSNRSIEDLIALLKQHNITALCDVRAAPYSSRNPQFNRKLLKQSLKSHNIEYVFLGEELGARPKDLSCYVEGKAIYQKITNKYDKFVDEYNNFCSTLTYKARYDILTPIYDHAPDLDWSKGLSQD